MTQFPLLRLPWNSTHEAHKI